MKNFLKFETVAEAHERIDAFEEDGDGSERYYLTPLWGGGFGIEVYREDENGNYIHRGLK